MRNRVVGLACLLVFCMAHFALARSTSDFVPTYQPLRPVVKPQHIAIAPDARPGHVVVKFKRGVAIDAKSSRIGGDGATVVRQIAQENGLADWIPSITGDPQTIREKRMAAEDRVKMNLPDLSLYFETAVDDPAVAAEVIDRLNRRDEVEIAYFQPQAELASKTDFVITPNWETNQDYIDPAPGGVDAYAAWTVPGGNGQGIQIVDVEYGWQLTHEDMTKGLTAVGIGANSTDAAFRNHGTAVMGEMVADSNEFGTIGIAYEADFGHSSASQGTAQAIYSAIGVSEPGDVVLIELHAPGPHYNFQSREDQLGYVAMEYWDLNFAAILNGYANGVIVCEAAGNGSEDFDSPIYDTIFQRDYRNSHAIICGAGYPPAAGSLDRYKLGFSNYGSRVDLQGYGVSVYTTGYGDLYAGSSQDEWYTSGFSGTSSASPIVTASVASLSGVFKNWYSTIIDADSIRALLVATGSPQMPDPPTLLIGPRPNLAGAIGLTFEPVDSIWYGAIELAPGEKVPVPVMLKNSHAVNDIYLPFKLTGSPTIFIDSITRGARTAGFESASIVFDNRFAGEIGALLRANAGGGAPLLPAGEGEVAQLWVHTTANAVAGQVETIDSTWLGASTRLRLVSYFHDGYPDFFAAGSITIGPSCDCLHQGDYDDDTFLTALDLSDLIDVLFASGTDPIDPICPVPRGDLDCDGFSTALDLSVLIDHLFAGGAGPCDPCL